LERKKGEILKKVLIENI